MPSSSTTIAIDFNEINEINEIMKQVQFSTITITTSA